MPQEVVNILTNEAKVAPEFHSSGIKLERISSGISLTIPHMKISDEGIIIYTHHNSSHQCEISSSPHSCVYNFSKSVLSLSDTGTYYCAVATCGKILLGNGTTVDLTKTVSPAVIWLGAALGACVIVIFVQAILICKWRNCRPSSEKQSTATVRKINQDHDSVELSYAALRFNKRKTGRNHREKEQTQDCMYSDIRCPTVTDQILFD
ncbi:uncharacterized protein LOC118242259 [Electrophorus electricus]|uniref:uncharacterized protein LOC118242259 n=1 Tax=Electrophorus electricus TaxID=8005 RepID=UPI0015D061CC|nr:uncharacterized protein LOC118242259 [Electrophorus electricus]